jgi:DNA repair protein RadC
VNKGEAELWAGRLLAEFGSIGGIMAQPPESITRVARSREPAAALGSLAALTREWLRERACAAQVLGDRPELVAYLRAEHSFAADEWVRVLFLNSRNLLMRDELLWQGTLDQCPFWPRVILRRSLELNAAGVILVHNHPSGDHAPSGSDVQVTKQLCRTARELGVEVHDHLIFSCNGYSSLRALGLL